MLLLKDFFKGKLMHAWVWKNIMNTITLQYTASRVAVMYMIDECQKKIITNKSSQTAIQSLCQTARISKKHNVHNNILRSTHLPSWTPFCLMPCCKPHLSPSYFTVPNLTGIFTDVFIISSNGLLLTLGIKTAWKTVEIPQMASTKERDPITGQVMATLTIFTNSALWAELV